MSALSVLKHYFILFVLLIVGVLTTIIVFLLFFIIIEDIPLYLETVKELQFFKRPHYAVNLIFLV
jgi:hypothetical protein